jgi:hypothetical protein
MQVGIVGLPFSGKTTIFNALTHARAKTGDFSGGAKEPNRAVVKIPDDRVYRLAELYNPKKTTPAEVEWVDVGGVTGKAKEKPSEAEFLTHLRDVDALALVVRLFEDANVVHPQGKIDPERDIESFELDMIVIDLDIIEKRMKKLEKSAKTGKSDADKKEFELLTRCKEALDKETPLRDLDFTEEEEKWLRGFAFLSLKPLFVLLNIGEADIKNKEALEKEYSKILKHKKTGITSVCGKLEAELSQLEEKDRAAFMQELGIKGSALDRILDLSYKLLGLISFFTANENEVKAWTVPSGTTALKAAGTVHSDMEKGFIKAEVMNFDKLIEVGSLSHAREKGELKLEGKNYLVQDGDVIFFRFNV